MAYEEEAEQIREANIGFYKAFESLQISNMSKVWAETEYVKCVHPGWPVLSGWKPVMSSWEAIFRNTLEISFQISDVQLHVKDNLAWVVLTENIIMKIGAEKTITPIHATNIFEKIDGKWLMIHHHASHILNEPQRF